MNGPQEEGGYYIQKGNGDFVITATGVFGRIPGYRGKQSDAG
jgi:hypothetical protein